MDQEKTQVLKPVPTKVHVQVEEVPPNLQGPQKSEPPPKKQSKGWIKWLVIFLVFALGCFVGYKVMYSWQTNSQKNYNEKIHQVELLRAESDKLEQESESLKAKRKELQQYEAALEGEKASLTKEKSFIQEFFDEITGKADEERSQVEQIQGKIKATKAALDEVDQSLDKVKELQAKTKNLTDKALQDLQLYEGQWDGFIYKLKLFLNNFKGLKSLLTN